MKILKDELVSTHTLELEIDLSKDDAEDIHYKYCASEGYEIANEKIEGNILTVKLVKVTTTTI